VQVLITYDVSTVTSEGRRRLRQAAKACLDYGQRVQNSVFECLVDPSQLVTVRDRLLKIIDPTTDSVRIYLLGKDWDHRVEHYGAKPSFNPTGPLVI
jgi:CRISPR-associated protein Cas2